MNRMIDVGKEFNHRLVYSTEVVGYENNGVTFRKRFLKDADNPEFWVNPPKSYIVFDFQNVTLMGPGFAANAFVYFRSYASKETILDTFTFINMNKVHRIILEDELDPEW